MNPEGIPSISPGLRGTSYPGCARKGFSTPPGVYGFLERGRARCNPYRVGIQIHQPPRVARASQPWAERWNPFRIRLWKLEVGRWTLDVGRWTLDVGRWTLDVGRCTLHAGRCTFRLFTRQI